MVIKFYFDKISKNKPYPNIATHQAMPYTPEWREFSLTSPFSEPPNLIEFMNYNNVPYNIVPFNETTNDTFYLIAISWFDFSVDWFSLMSKEIITKLRTEKLKVLFYYWEADNPFRIDIHITHLCKLHNVPRGQVKFISGNSQASNINNFCYFADDELLFQFRNEKVKAIPFNTHKREKKFTALVRMHKFWRANTMAKLWNQELHNDGYFSYGIDVKAPETEEDNPIEVDNFDNLRVLTHQFLKKCPFIADDLSSSLHNDHRKTTTEHFNNSYINVVLESHMDVDQSNGVLLSEKTFKPIKHAQPFIIVGAQGSLKQLRDMGYKTFDDVLDQGYDSIQNTTERWHYAMDVLTKLLSKDITEIHNIYISLKNDIIHNQQLFMSSKANRINILINNLHND
jgi:hypothetical protein